MTPREASIWVFLEDKPATLAEIVDHLGHPEKHVRLTLGIMVYAGSVRETRQEGSPRLYARVA
jgi:DNA-binding transcriptional regulator PaaX